MKIIATSPFSDTIELDDKDDVMERVPKGVSRAARYLWLELELGHQPAADDRTAELDDAILELWHYGALELRTKEAT